MDGHLSLLVELLTFRSVAERHHIGSKSGGERLIEVMCRVDVAHNLPSLPTSHRL